MMTRFPELILAAVALIACYVGYFIGYHEGKLEGHAKGLKQADIDEEAAYHRGRLDADNWWIRADAEVDQARQKIWREK